MTAKVRMTKSATIWNLPCAAFSLVLFDRVLAFYWAIEVPVAARRVK
jgi:hypothetical protein